VHKSLNIYASKYPDWNKFIKESLNPYEVKLNTLIGGPIEDRQIQFGEKSYIERDNNIKLQNSIQIPKLEYNGKNSELDNELSKSDGEILNKFAESLIKLPPENKILMARSNLY